MFNAMTPISEVLNVDCLEYMKTLPDNHFDLCIADPPYGICINESIGRRKGDAHSGRKKLCGIRSRQAKKCLIVFSGLAEIL